MWRSCPAGVSQLGAGSPTRRNSKNSATPPCYTYSGYKDLPAALLATDDLEKPAVFAAAGIERRSFMRNAAYFGLFACAPALNLLAGPSTAANWRGFVGCIKPRARGSSLGDMIRLLPPGIDVAAVYLNLAEGTREEMQNSYGTYEKNIAYLASQRCDIISIEGAPPLLLRGPGE